MCAILFAFRFCAFFAHYFEEKVKNMTEKEIRELRRRQRPDRTNMTAVCGCYVSPSKEILSTFRQSFGLMSEEDKELYTGLFRRTLSGAIDKNLIDVTFRTQQVADSDEHRLLMRLKDSQLSDEAALQTLYETIIGALSFDTNFLILLAAERYDVPRKARDGASLEDSDDVFSYILCAICPVKTGKAALSFDAEDKAFHIRSAGSVASNPELGFLFPAFDARRSNIYNCLYYSHSAQSNHPELIEALFHVDPPAPAQEQKQTFDALLSDTLEQECRFDVVQSVQSDLRERIAAHKEAKIDEPLTVSKSEVSSTLAACGISEEKLARFNVKFDQSFGDNAALAPTNLVDTKKLQLKTPDVVIQVNPDRSDLLQTRVLGGVKYILVCADDGVEVNGVNIQIE